MFKDEVAFYLGEQKPDGYSGIIFQDELYLVMEIASGMTEEEGHSTLDYVKEKIKQEKIVNLASFEDFIIKIIKEKNLPTGFSLSAAFRKDNILYLKTAGEGKVFIRRKNKLGILIEGDATASGPIENEDFFIFLTDNFLNLIAGSQGLDQTFDHRSPTEIIDEITPSLKAKQDIGAVALFVNIKKDEDNTSFYEQEKNQISSPVLKDKYFEIKQYLQTIGQKKTLTLITVGLLFVIFIWSVVLGYQRRVSSTAMNKIKLANELVSQKLASAEEVAFLNMGRALVLISESKDVVSGLKKEVGTKNNEIANLEKMIETTENKILKKDSLKFIEFYDLTVDDKDASGSKIYLDEENSYILDNKRGAAYQFSLEKKSFKKTIAQEIKSAELIAGFGDEIFFYVRNSGVYRIDSEKKISKIIENDSEWGEIKDVYLFNGNIYLLDKGQNEVWKYPRGADTYGNKNAYFESGQAINFSSINSLAIDGSVYIGGSSVIVKYTSGLRDAFSTDLPDKQPNFDKIYTSRNIEKIYLWDKKKGTVYVLGKTGEYIEQIYSEILSKGNDFIVYKDEVYILAGSKIYKVEK